MKIKVKFTILGPPKGKGRPRVEKNGHAHTPEDTFVYENLVKMEYIRQCGRQKFEPKVPLDVRITAYFQIPNSESGKKKDAMRKHRVRPTVKPDFDNIGKIICDSLNHIAYHDDAQIVDCQVRKFYSDDPRVVVTIQEATTNF